MIKFGHAYNLYANRGYTNSSQKTTKTNEDAVDNQKDTPLKKELNIGRGEEDRQWTDPKDGGETLAKAIVKNGEPCPNARFADWSNYCTAYESLYGVQPYSKTDDYTYDPRTIYTEAGLREYGITDTSIIDQYYDDMGVQKGKFGDFQSYSLKNDIIINGKAITTTEELVEALDVDTEPYKMANNLQELKNWGLTDEEIAEYFDYTESNTQDDVVLSGYCIKKGLIINDKKIKSFEDLKEALALVDTTKMALPAIYLKKYGFTQTEIDKYFNKYPTTDYKGNPTFNYGLKRGIIINGQGVNSFNELIEILNKKNVFNFFRQ